MRYFKFLIIGLVVFFLTFLDVSFFSFIDIYGATLLSSFTFLIIFCITDQTHKEYIIVSLLTVFFFSVFSSLPISAILIGFFVIPATVVFVRTHYLPEPNLGTSIIYFFISSFLLEGFFLIYAKSWNVLGFLTLSWFIFINTFWGFWAYFFYLKIKRNFTLGEIKL
jgi:hypothetical protein